MLRTPVDGLRILTGVGERLYENEVQYLWQEYTVSSKRLEGKDNVMIKKGTLGV